MPRSSRTLMLALASAALAAACNTPRDAAQSDSAAGGTPMSKIDSTSNPATIDGDSTGRAATGADSAVTPAPPPKS